MIATRWVTVEQFSKDKRFEKGYYLLRGEVIRDMGNAHSLHETVKAIVARFFTRLLDGRNIDGLVLSDTSYEFDDITLAAPDVSVQIPLRKARAGEYFQNSPEIAIEILSPSNSVSEQDEKAKLYYTHGAKIVLVLDPSGKKTYLVTREGQWESVISIEFASHKFELDFWSEVEDCIIR